MSNDSTERLNGVWGSSGDDVFAVGSPSIMGGPGIILHYGPLTRALAKAVLPGPTVLAGEPVTFTLAFSNPSAFTFTRAVITDVVPAEVTQLSFDSSRPVTPTGTVSYTWLLGDLQPGESGVITITGVVSPGLGIGHAFTNTATISGATLDTSLTYNRSSARMAIRSSLPAVYLPVVLRYY